MASRGQPLAVTVTAWNTVLNRPQTGDAGNLTLRWLKDDALTVPTNAPTEKSVTFAPGEYTIQLTASECDCWLGKLVGTSSTPYVVIIPMPVSFEQLPTAAAGASGGLPTVDAAGKVAAKMAAADMSGTLSVTAATVSDKTGYSLATPPPSAAENAAAVWGATTRTLTSFGTLASDTASAVWSATTRTLTGFGTLVTDMATAVWSAASRLLTGTQATQLGYLDATVSSRASQSSVSTLSPIQGPNAVTINVDDGNGHVIDGAVVKLQSDTCTASTMTSTSGRYTLGVTSGTYALTVGITGYKAYAQTGIAISAATTLTAHLTATVLPEPETDNEVSCYFYTRDKFGVAEPEETVSIALVSPPGTTGVAYNYEISTLTSDGDGLITVNLVKGAKYEFYRNGEKRRQTIPSTVATPPYKLQDV